MSEFTAYFITDAGITAGVHIIQTDTEAKAVETARHLLIEARFPTVEIWDSRCHLATINLE